MSKNKFSRSNVNESTLSISAPLRSSFDLSERSCMTLPYGRLIPAHTQRFMPDSLISGKMDVNLQLEKIATPTIGRLRLDTHEFLVYDNRVNKDIKQFIGNDLGSTEKLPSFPAWSIYGYLLGAILGVDGDSSWFDGVVPDPSPGTTKQPEQYSSGLAVDIFVKAIAHYKSLSEDTTDIHAYLKDFYAVEVERLTEVSHALVYTFNEATQTWTPIYTEDIPGIITRTIYEIMRPYIGAGSVIEQLGYPKMSMYSFEYETFKSEDDLGWDTSSPGWQDQTISEYFINAYSGPRYNKEQVVSEMLLRKQYAVWFDYFRDFQIEKRENILDPDTFGKEPLLHTELTFADLDVFVQLMIAKYRYYGRDMLTTTQVDDIWRHVYAPIFYNGTAGADIGDVKSNSSLASYQLQNAIDMIDLTSSKSGSDSFVGFPFPAGNDLANTTQLAVLKHDLMVQRRAGMLEKYLMRKFFNPDTYSGVMEAHYGVKPEDYQLSCSQYLGGTEVMVNGEQNYANIETDATPRGTRTLVGGVSTDKDKGSFSYRVGGGFADLITFVSLVPMVKYDAANPHLSEIHPTDMPLPEFAQDSRVEIRTQDLLRGFQYDTKTLGFVPRYMHYRSSLDKVHGDYLEGKRVYDFVRDWYNITNESSQPIVGSPVDHSFELSPYSLRIHMRPDAFIGLSEWSNVAYGSVDLDLFVDCPLPAAIDFM